MDHYASLVQGDARSLPLATRSIDLIVTSPPYYGLRTYTDGGKGFADQIGNEQSLSDYLNALLASTAEMARVVKDEGSIFVNVGDKYAGVGKQSSPTGLNPDEEAKQGARDGNRRSRPGRIDGIPPKSLAGIPWRYAIRCIDELGLILRAEIVWHKPNAMPETVTDRARRTHEHWFHFTKSSAYFHRQINPGASVLSVSTEPLRIPTNFSITHTAAFPAYWPWRFINGWCPDDGIVFDPYSGTGTTGAVARAMGHHSINLDLSNDYHQIAKWRTAGDGYGKVAEKLNRYRQGS